MAYVAIAYVVMAYVAIAYVVMASSVETGSGPTARISVPWLMPPYKALKPPITKMSEGLAMSGAR